MTHRAELTVLPGGAEGDDPADPAMIEADHLVGIAVWGDTERAADYVHVVTRRGQVWWYDPRTGGWVRLPPVPETVADLERRAAAEREL